MDPLSKAERYLRQAEECVTLAKAATSNKMQVAFSGCIMARLAEAEPTINNQDAGSDRGHIPSTPSATS